MLSKILATQACTIHSYYAHITKHSCCLAFAVICTELNEAVCVQTMLVICALSRCSHGQQDNHHKKMHNIQ